MTVPRLDALLHRPGPVRIVLEQLFVVIRLDHEGVNLTQPFDYHFGRVTKIGDKPKRIGPRVKSIADRVNRIMRDGKSLDKDIAD